MFNSWKTFNWGKRLLKYNIFRSLEEIFIECNAIYFFYLDCAIPNSTLYIIFQMFLLISIAQAQGKHGRFKFLFIYYLQRPLGYCAPLHSNVWFFPVFSSLSIWQSLKKSRKPTDYYLMLHENENEMIFLPASSLKGNLWKGGTQCWEGGVGENDKDRTFMKM